LKSYLSATKPKRRAPRNFPRDTAICTVDLRGVRLHTRSHYKQKKAQISLWENNYCSPLTLKFPAGYYVFTSN
jgi:hypothetical protein